MLSTFVCSLECYPLLTQILTWFIYAGNAITLLTVWQESLFFSEISHNYGTLGGRNREPLQSGIEVSEWWKVILAVNSFQIHQGVPHHPSSTFQVSTETMSRYDSITGILACLQLATRKQWNTGSSSHDLPFPGVRKSYLLLNWDTQVY